MGDCTHERSAVTEGGSRQCDDCRAVEVHYWQKLDDPRGCYTCMGYLGHSLHCGINGLCKKCRERTGDAPSERDLERRREELDRWMRDEIAGLGLSEADVLSATETSYRAFYWWALDRVRTRYGLPGGHFRSRQGDDLPRPELVPVRQ